MLSLISYLCNIGFIGAVDDWTHETILSLVSRQVHDFALGFRILLFLVSQPRHGRRKNIFDFCSAMTHLKLICFGVNFPPAKSVRSHCCQTPFVNSPLSPVSVLPSRPLARTPVFDRSRYQDLLLPMGPRGIQCFTLAVAFRPSLSSVSNSSENRAAATSSRPTRRAVATEEGGPKATVPLRPVRAADAAMRVRMNCMAFRSTADDINV